MSRAGENIYKRKDGRWEGRYTKGRKKNGTIHYGYVYGKTYNEVRMVLLPLKQEYALLCEINGRYSGSVSDWMKSWLIEEVKQKNKPSTYASYHYKVIHYILPQLGEIALNRLTINHLENTVLFWRESKGLSASTIQILVTLLRKSLQTAVSMGFLTTNVCIGIEVPKEKRKRIGCLSKEQQRKIEKVAKQDKQGLPTLLALHTGLRIGELAALSWSDIDLEEQIIHVRHTYQRVNDPQSKKTALVLGPAKTESSERKVPFTSEVKKWLLNWRKESNHSQFLFSKNERPVEPRLLTYHFKRILNMAGEPQFHFHQLRHTFATRCLEAQGDIVSISVLLGHSSAKTTLDVYMDSQLDQRRKVIAQMENIIYF